MAADDNLRGGRVRDWDPKNGGATLPLLRPDKYDSALFVAARQEGKTTLVRYLVKQIVNKTKPKKGGFHLIFVFSNSEQTLEEYKKFVPWLTARSRGRQRDSSSGSGSEVEDDERPFNFINFEQNGDVAIDKLMRLQARDPEQKTRVLVILDDVISSDLRYNDRVNKFFTQGRHSRIAVWLVAQAYTAAVSTQVRKNADLMVFMRIRSGTEAKTVQDEVLAGCCHPTDVGMVALPETGTVPTKKRELLEGLFTECTSEYRAMVVDHRQKKTRLALMLHRFRVPDEFV